MADLPVILDEALADRLAKVLDVEGKIPRALDALGPVRGRDVLAVGYPTGLRVRQLESLGGRIHTAAALDDARDLVAESFDLIVS